MRSSSEAMSFMREARTRPSEYTFVPPYCRVPVTDRIAGTRSARLWDCSCAKDSCDRKRTTGLLCLRRRRRRCLHRFSDCSATGSVLLLLASTGTKTRCRCCSMWRMRRRCSSRRACLQSQHEAATEKSSEICYILRMLCFVPLVMLSEAMCRDRTWSEDQKAGFGATLSCVIDPIVGI
jgi:hypothetical protein